MKGLLWLWLLDLVACRSDWQRHTRDSDLADFLTERANWDPMCLYTFDDPAITNGTIVMNRVPNDVCPFDALKAEENVVTSLNTESTFWQLGVRLGEDSTTDPKHVQLSSISTVSARDFFTMAAVRNGSDASSGVTFEMVIRRYAPTNQSMTLFSIANEFNNCVDAGFRLDLNEHQVLVFIYSLPVLEEGGVAGVEACYEQRLFSVDISAACQLPPLLDPVERTPPVQITVTLDPSSQRGLWTTSFYMSYTDVETEQRMHCMVHDDQHPPNAQVLNKLIEGRYQLYLGNSPRNVTWPRQRKRLAPARDLHYPRNTSNLNATEQLRAVLKQKLMNISGPRLPKAMRIFNDNSLSLHVFGITFPPLSEDTPLAYLRSKFADFKEQYGDQIVEYLVNLVQQRTRDPLVVQQFQGDQNRSKSKEFSSDTLFQGASSASFDLFHFAIYRRVVSEDQVNAVSKQQLMPSRQFPALHQTVRIPEDSLVLLNLTMLHGVYDDLRLELRDIPEFGQLLLYPDKTRVTLDNIDAFRELPREYQQSIFYRPEPDQNNENLPLPNPVAFSRRLRPYATIKYGISDSRAARDVNKSMEAKIDIYVDAVNDAPCPRRSVLEVRVKRGVPVSLDLNGEDSDGAPQNAKPNAGAIDSKDLLSRFTYTNATIGRTSVQMLKLERMPRYGKLFDCNSTCEALSLVRGQNLQSLEAIRIYSNSTNIVNATHSTNLVYVYHGWGQVEDEKALSVVDELWYKLSDGDPNVFSAIAVVKFLVVTDTDTAATDNVLAAVQLEEDSIQLLNLIALDPLAAFFNVKTQLDLTVLPQHGTLYQYNDHDGRSLHADNTNVGARISSPGTIVSDFRGRVIYVPKLDYFNVELKTLRTRPIDLDYFEYQVLNTTPSTNISLVVCEASPSANFANGRKARRIELAVVNVPDALIVLPPFVFTTSSSSSDPIPTSIAFDDPDSTTRDTLYQVNLEAGDDVSEFELGFAITDDDVMIGCPLERPCILNRSTNGSSFNQSSSRNNDRLQFHITTQLYDPAHVQVTGTRTALRTALSALTFRDLSGISSLHTSQFTFWIKRVDLNDADAVQARASFTIHFQTNEQSGLIPGNKLISMMNSELKRYTSTLLVLIVGWLVLSNASCMTTGLCCCCCRKKRQQLREKFEQQQRLFQAQVSQNDHEYSVLLMDLADLLLEPNLLVSTCMLECCLTSKGSPKPAELLTQAFVLQSLLPLLESERQGTRFVFQLVATEYAKGIISTSDASLFLRQRFLQQHSIASKALACFCRLMGAKWLSTLLMPSDDTSAVYLHATISDFESFVDRLVVQVEALPVEILILCRGCVKLVQKDKAGPNRVMELDAVHLVFFNHFLGPALLFPTTTVAGFSPSLEQQKTLRAMAYGIVEVMNPWINLRSCIQGQITAVSRLQYKAVLERISQSPSIASTYDPNEAKGDVDPDLMGLCLMNIHSLLDSYYVHFNRRILFAQTSANFEQIQGIVTRMNRLLKALSWPLASIHEFVAYARLELWNDPLLWNDFSFQKWQERAQIQQEQVVSKRQVEDVTLQSSRTEEVVLEQDDRSPHAVDWL